MQSYAIHTHYMQYNNHINNYIIIIISSRFIYALKLLLEIGCPNFIAQIHVMEL